MRCDVANRLKVKRGEELPWAKLTEDDVRLIRRIHSEGAEQIKRIQSSCTAKALAEKFGVHMGTVEKLLRYETWRHVRDE